MIPDLAGNSGLDAESDPLPRIASGKGRRTEDERFRSSKGAREMSQDKEMKAGTCIPLLDPAGRSQDKKNKLPWNVLSM